MGLFLVGLLLFTLGYFWFRTPRLVVPKVMSVVSIGLVAGALVWRANPTISWFLGIVGLSIILSLFYLLVNRFETFRAVSEFLLLVPRTGWRYIRSAIPGIKSLGQSDDSVKVSQKLGTLPLKSLLIGIVVSLPVVVVLIALLAGADPIFQKTIENAISADIMERLIQHIFLSLVLFVGLLPLLNISYTEFKSPLRFLRSRSFGTEYSVVMTLVAMVLALFVVLQWQYVFIPAVDGVDLAQFGFNTYSEYVQKGFGEMIAATLFVFSLIWLGLVILNKPGKKSYLLGVQLLVLAEFGVILAAFFRRIWLYQYFHGMTLVRFFGGYFVAVVGLLALSLLARHLWRRNWITVELVLLSAAAVLLGFINIERYIVDHPPTVNKRVDYSYLSRLSADGYMGWLKAYDWSQQVHQQLATQTQFSGEDRRQLAYAGLVTQQLLNHYDQLMRVYGTPEEQQQYQQQVLTHVRDNIDERMAEMDRQLSIIPIGTDSALVNFQTSHSIDAERSLLSYRDQLEKQKIDLNYALGDLTKPVSEQQYVLTFSQLSSYGINQKYAANERCLQLKWCINVDYTPSYWSDMLPKSWYRLSKSAPPQPLNRLERILLYNYTEANTFQRMQQELSLEQLLRLQADHFKVYEQVMLTAKQPSDLAFEPDISLNTPFLKPVSIGSY